jgi:La-related protein 7
MFLSYLFGCTAVPIAVIASTKKMRSLVSDNDLLAQALKSSSKLVTSFS